MCESLWGVTLLLVSVLSFSFCNGVTRFRMPRRPEVTHEEATDLMDDAWVLNYEREGVAIRNVLEGRIRVSGFETSNQLHMIIDLIFTFFDKERENWTRWKYKYTRLLKHCLM